jgi:hypothetical protein
MESDEHETSDAHHHLATIVARTQVEMTPCSVVPWAPKPFQLVTTLVNEQARRLDQHGRGRKGCNLQYQKPSPALMELVARRPWVGQVVTEVINRGMKIDDVAPVVYMGASQLHPDVIAAGIAHIQCPFDWGRTPEERFINACVSLRSWYCFNRPGHIHAGHWFQVSDDMDILGFVKQNDDQVAGVWYRWAATYGDSMLSVALAHMMSQAASDQLSDRQKRAMEHILESGDARMQRALEQMAS